MYIRISVLGLLYFFSAQVIAATYGIYGYVGSFRDNFFTISKTSGEVLATTDFIFEGDVEGFLGGQGLAVGPDGKLYVLAREADPGYLSTPDPIWGYDSTTALVSVDIDTGSVQLISWLDDDYYHSLTFGADGTAYFRGGNSGDKAEQVLSFDIATDTLSMVSDAYGGFSKPGNLAFNPLDGKLYSLDQSGDPSWFVWDLDLATGSRVAITSTISDEKFGYGIFWDTEASAFLVSASGNELWHITPAGEAIQICDSCGDESWRGLASTDTAEETFRELESSIYYQPQAQSSAALPVPTQPWPVLLLLSGLLGLFALRGLKD